MLTPKELQEQKELWKVCLEDFERIYPVFQEHGITKNTAFMMFVGGVPIYEGDSEEGESWLNN